jgi:hypothetical protein
MPGESARQAPDLPLRLSSHSEFRREATRDWVRVARMTYSMT